MHVDGGIEAIQRLAGGDEGTADRTVPSSAVMATLPAETILPLTVRRMHSGTSSRTAFLGVVTWAPVGIRYNEYRNWFRKRQRANQPTEAVSLSLSTKPELLN